MKTSDFYYDLPPELIAQTPLENRSDSRLMVCDIQKNEISDNRFYNIGDYLKKGDLLIMNDSKVLPARLYGIKEGGTSVIELLLLENKAVATAEDDQQFGVGSVWETLVKPGRKAKVGAKIKFSQELYGTITDVLENGNRLIKFESKRNIYDILFEIGQMPLPHYIKEKLEDKDRYQTVYADKLGSSAAPTAGLHFTKELIEKLKTEVGVQVEFVTLHVGIGTFRPVKVEDIADHQMHSEHFYMSQRTAKAIKQTKANGGRVIALGTTSCRTLETIANRYDDFCECSGYTDIFITPGYEFKVLDGLITNFHLPESTLIMLVSAFAGYELTMRAYKEAVDKEYRFFSFGDSMFLTGKK